MVAQRNPSLDLGAYLVHGPRRAVDQQVLLEEGRIVLDGQAHHVDDVGQGVEGLALGDRRSAANAPCMCVAMRSRRRWSSVAVGCWDESACCGGKLAGVGHFPPR